MKITIFGATGMVGSHLVEEAIDRGHQVTAVVRNKSKTHRLTKGVTPAVLDLSQSNQVSDLLSGQDLVISAIRPPVGREADLAIHTKIVLDGAKKAGVRAIIIGGAARLRIPDGSGNTVLTAPGFLPDTVRPIAEACMKQLEACQVAEFESWTYFSPPANLTHGQRTGAYRLGSDTLLVDDQGQSSISLADFAVAVLDHSEQSLPNAMRLTAGY